MKRQGENSDQLVASLYQKLLSLESKYLHFVHTCRSVLEEKHMKISEEELTCGESVLPSLRYQRKRLESELEILKKSQVEVESTGEIQKIYAEILNRAREVEEQMVEITGSSHRTTVRDSFKNMVSFFWKLIFNKTEASKTEPSKLIGKAPKYKATINSLTKEKTYLEEQLRRTMNENNKIRTQMKDLKQSTRHHSKQIEKSKINNLKHSPRGLKSPKPPKALKMPSCLLKKNWSAELDTNLNLPVIVKYSNKILSQALLIEKLSANKGKIEKYRLNIQKYIRALDHNRESSPFYRNTPERLRNLSLTNTLEQMATNTIQNLQKIQFKLLESEKKVHKLASKVENVQNHRQILNQITKKELENQEREYHTKIESLNTEVKKLKNTVEEISNENTLINNDLLMQKEKHEEVLERNLFLEDRISVGSAGANPVLEWEIQQLKRDSETKESEIEQLNRIIEQMDQEFSSYECRKCLEQNAGKPGDEELAQLKKAFDHLANQYNSLYTQFSEVKSLLKTSEEKCTTLRAKKSKYKAMCLNAPTLIEHPEKNSLIVEEENMNLKRCVEYYKHTYSKLKEENAQLNTKLEDLIHTPREYLPTKNSEHSFRVKQLQYELEKTKKECVELSSRLNDSENSSTQELKYELNSSGLKLKEITDQLNAKTSFINTAYSFVLKTYSQLSDLSEDLYSLETSELEEKITQCLRDLAIIQSGYKNHNDRNALFAIEDAFATKNSEISELKALVTRCSPEKYKGKIRSLKQELSYALAENKVLTLKLEETLSSGKTPTGHLQRPRKLPGELRTANK